MKIDINFIKEILEVIENNEKSSITNEELLTGLNIKKGCEIKELDKLLNHINDLKDIDCINFKGESINWNIDGYVFHLYGIYRITNSGRNLLEILKNDSWWNKIKNTTKDITYETLKQAPSILISIILNMPK